MSAPSTTAAHTVGPLEGPHPLTTAQLGLWVSGAQLTDPAAYVITEVTNVVGPLDPQIWQAAVHHVLAGTASLRLTLRDTADGIPTQHLGAEPVTAQVLDLRGEDDPAAAAADYVDSVRRQPIDLRRGTVGGATLLQLADDRSQWVLRVHHLALDGFGFALIARRLASAIRALASGEELPVLDDATDLAAVIAAQQAYDDSPEAGEDRQWWAQQAPEQLGRGVLAGDGSRTHRVELADLDPARGLRTAAELVHPERLLAGAALLARRLTGRSEVVLGVHVVSRHDALAMRTPTTLQNLVPLRVDVGPWDTVESLVEQCRDVWSQSRPHHRYRHESIRRDRGLGPDEPLADVFVNLTPFGGPVRLPHATATPAPVWEGPVEGLTLGTRPVAGGGMTLTLEAPTDASNPALLRELATSVLAMSDADADRPVGVLDRSHTERVRTGAPLSAPDLQTLITGLATDRGDRVAVTDERGSTSFSELAQQVAAWADALHRRGAQPGSRIAIALPRSTAALAATLGVLAVRAVFVPVDPAWPAERRRQVLEAAGADLVIADARTDGLTTVTPGDAAAVGDTWPPSADQQASERDAEAYVLFTSGTTGRPKGVVVTRDNLADLVARVDHVLLAPMVEKARGRTGRSWLRLGHNHPLTFDSALSPLAALLLGHELVLADGATCADPARLAQLYASREVQALDVAPAVLEQMLEEGFDLGPDGPVAGVVVGGDACSPALWSRLHAADHLVARNDYGPTECTVGAVTADVSEHPTPSIGTSQPGTYALVLDADLRPCPDGVAGELYLGGTGVARGYCGLPGLTASRFVADPGGGGARLYRTGDQAIREHDGSLTFLGRSDDQLSLRGVRIESGEVEAALARLPGVTETAVAIRDDGHGPRLVGYVSGAPELDPVEARSRLRDLLPANAVPAVVVPLARMPLTPRGKIDRPALPEPAVPEEHGRTFEQMSPLEQQVAVAFAEVLDLPAHGLTTDSDLFALGGHSLSATRVVARLDPARTGSVPLARLFDHPTVEALAQTLPAAVGEAAPPHPPADDDRHPLTAAQRRLWFVDRTANPPDATYIIPLLLTLRGPLDLPALRCAVGDIVARHPALRTVFHADDAIDVRPQIIDPATARDLVETLEVDDERALRDEARRPFDLSSDLPVRLAVRRVVADEHQVLLAIHHIAADGWSLAPLLADLAEAYERRRTGAQTPEPEEAPAMPPPAVVTDVDLEWWRAHLSGAPEETDLPGSSPRPTQRSTAGGEVIRTWSAELTDRIERVAHEHGATPFMVLQATLAGLLTRCGAGDDIVLGTVSSGRSTVAKERLVTFLANTVALRTSTAGDPAFGDLLRRVRDATVDSLSHAHVPFDQVVEAVNPARSAHRHPLFQVMLVLQNGAESAWDTADLEASVETIGTGTAKFDLTVEVDLPRDAPARIRLEHATDVLDTSAVELFASWFVELLTRFTREPAERLWERPLDAHAPVPPGPPVSVSTETLTDRLEEAFTSFGSRVALTGEGRALTYRELDERSAQVRDSLLRHGIRRGDLVAVAVPRGIDQVTAVVGTLRAGAAYLPLDPAYPLERLTSTLDEGRPRALVVPAADPADPLIAHAGPDLVVPLDRPAGDGTPLPGRQAPRVTDPAYVIFTSGSTGRPKGVRISHHNVVRLLDETRPWFDFSPDDVWTLFHSYAFDFAVWEMFGALTHGARLVLVDQDTARSPRAFLDLLVTERVTVLNQTPSAFAQLAAADQHHPEIGDRLQVRFVVLGGEAMDPAVLPGWFARHPAGRPDVINMYGITETTVHVTYQRVDEETGGRSPVGVPIPDLGVRLLDQGLHPVPTGVVGEIYVSGAGLADGYLGRPGLTATRFVADPYGAPGTRMYRSGDLAVQTLDGRLDFRGRADRQVQLRGFRIELGDVEAGVLQLAEVDQAHAQVHRVRAGDERLIAYVVGPDPASADPADLRTRLRDCLPAQMVPSLIIPIPRMPLTVNGKLDTATLPAPTSVAGRTSARPPSNEREEQLVALFADLLGLEHVGVEDSFFDLGGHSLLAVRLLDRIGSATGTDVSIATLFAAPTPALLAEAMSSTADTAGSSPDSSLGVLLRLRPGDDGPGVFCIHPAGGLAWCYAGLSRHLPPGTGLWGLQARGVTDPDSQPESLATMADDYLAQIRAVQPTGPYHLLGWSLGGMVAQVMAARLEAAGEQVGVVALLDAYPSQAESDVEEPPEEDALSALLAMGGYEDSAIGGRPMTLAAVAEVFREGGSAMAGLSLGTLSRLLRTYRNTARILREYAHETSSGPMDFFRAARAGRGPDHDPGEWDTHVTGPITVHDLDCTHREMTQPGPLAEVGEVIARRIAAGS